MRGLYLCSEEGFTNDILVRLSSNSPGGVLFTQLEWLDWHFGEAYTTLTSFHLFLSPNLIRVALHTIDFLHDTPSSQFAAFVQVVSLLPTSLEDLTIKFIGEVDRLEDTVSSFVCRSGPSLRSLSTGVPLSEAAIRHLMQLPNLRSWMVVQEPPRTIPTSIFPSLEHLCLDEPETLPWLHLLASHENDIVRNKSASSSSRSSITETLKSLDWPWNTTVDSITISPVLKFRNLVSLYMHTYCPHMEDCVFRLTDHDMESLAAALPRLENLQLGTPSHSCPCDTTFASLVSISVHCLDLTYLEIHINVLTIANDMRRLLDGCAGRGETKCKLRELSIGYLPHEVHAEDFTAGLKTIFPCLIELGGYPLR